MAEQVNVSISDVTTNSVNVTLTCGLDQTNAVDYILEDQISSQIQLLFCGVSQGLTDLIPNTNYALLRHYGDQICTVDAFTTTEMSSMYQYNNAYINFVHDLWY